jgi:hypothetical protein
MIEFITRILRVENYVFCLLMYHLVIRILRTSNLFDSSRKDKLLLNSYLWVFSGCVFS